MRRGLTVKHIDWQYEKEWRLIVDKTKDKAEFIEYPRQLLKGIIVGHNMKQRDVNMIKRAAPEGVVFLKTKPGEHSGYISLLPEDYDIQYTGEEMPFIKDINELERVLINE